MSQINVNVIKDSNKGAPDFPSGVNVSGVTSTVTLGVTNLNPTNVNVSGVVTATTLDGNLLSTGTPTLGLGVTINASGLNISGVATAGIVSATTLYGDGTNITGIALTIAPLNYNPAVGGLVVGSGSGIGITFNQKAVAGSGNVTLSIANAGVAGTVVENFGVGNSVSYSNGDTITITPTSSLDSSQTYHLNYPSGAFTNGGDVSYVGTAYTFITVGGELWVWGYNENGQLGLNQNGNYYSSPVQLPGKGWSNVFSSSYDDTGMGIRYNGELWMWGDNNYGPLGQNNQTKYSSPVQVPGTTWAEVAVADNSPAGASVFGIKTDGTAWSWGNNLSGQLGQNNRTSVSSPIQIPGTTWKQASGCEKSIMAVKTDGTLWAMGGNENARLGLNTPVNSFYSSPVQIPGTTWNAIETRASCSMGSKTDGTIWMWGSNSGGALGQNNRTERSSPVQVGGGTDWGITVHTMGSTAGRIGAIKTDGTLWTWGSNSFGCLGLNQPHPSYVSSPTQVPGTTWKSLTISPHTGLATKTDGTLWAWGINSYGQLAQNDLVNRSSPVQIGSETNWSFVARQCRHSGMMAQKEV
jgi:alpha-tubulin suppressor-like RCC1 family protein